MRRQIRRHPPLCKGSEPEPAWTVLFQPSPRANPARTASETASGCLQAAKAVFAAGGPEASLEAVARQAGVGVGTLYRHFPTRQALFEAVYRHEVEQLVELAEQLGTDLPPLEALRRWMHANVAFVATKKGMSAALAVAVHASSDLTAYSMDRLGRALETLLRRAVEAGVIRDDIGAGGHPADDRGPVLHARQAGLAEQRAPPGGRVRRRDAAKIA